MGRGRAATGAVQNPAPSPLLLADRAGEGPLTADQRGVESSLGQEQRPWAWGPCGWRGGCGGLIPLLPTALWAALHSDWERMGLEGQTEDKAPSTPRLPLQCLYEKFSRACVARLSINL